tara:strand:+ start:4953 stop:5201 length:249 start_codon:yes stop_codon:yes gene_type:complete
MILLAAITIMTFCVSLDNAAEAMRAKYSEQLIWSGTIATGKKTQLYHAKDGSWSLLIENPQGKLCLVAFGVRSELKIPGIKI